MYEINCQVCNRVIGFRSKKLYGKVKHQAEIKCIDCYFTQIKKIVEDNTK